MIESLEPARRRAIAQRWLARSSAEAGAGDNFRLIARSPHLAPEIVALAEAAVVDEAGHAELCRDVASQYAGRTLALPAPHQTTYPEYPGATPELVSLLHIVANCCFNETLATAFLELAHRDAEPPFVRAALRSLLADEVDHARMGWSCLQSTLAATPQLAGPLSSLVLPLVQMNRRMWLGSRTDRESHADPAHGCPSDASVAETVDDALRTLVLPGLQLAGLHVAPALSALQALEVPAQ